MILHSLFLLFAGSYVQALCSSMLNLEFLDTQNGNVTCADGTPAGFYYAKPDPVGPYSNFVVWFGDGALCGTQSDCLENHLLKSVSDPDLCTSNDYVDYAEDVLGKGQCYTTNLGHTSSWYFPNYTTIQSSNVLCGEDDHFKDYVRVYIPSCSLDWFLGNGGDAGSSSNFLWRGSRIVDAIFNRLQILSDIEHASRVVLMGGGGGGVGVVNSLKRLRDRLPLVPNVMAVVDSSFLVNAERFANLSRVYMGENEQAFKIDAELRKNTGAWIASAKTDPVCRSYWGAGESLRCFYISEVLKRMGEENRVMVIQSQYDLGMMSRLDLFNDTLYTLYTDNASYAQNAVGFIESFGRGVRRSIDAVAAVSAGGDNMYVYTPACGQFGYLVPTQHEEISVKILEMGRAGQLELSRSSEGWNNISVSDLTLRRALVDWIVEEGIKRPLASSSLLDQFDRNGVRGDKCSSFLCNPTCTMKVIPFSLTPIWGQCSQKLVVAYCLIVIGSFWLLFLMSSVAVCLFRNTTNRYWSQVIAAEQEASLRDNELETKLRNEAEDELVRDAFGSARRVHLMVYNLCYWAPPKQRRGKPYQILRNVTASFGAGNVHALMGPSGSGKSTLLDMVALIRESGTISGMHFVNGVNSFSPQAGFLREWLKHNVSYVKQQDNMFPLLTVREHLTHSAWLMLPEFMNTEDKLRRVWQVIKLLGLEKSAETICGDGGVEVEGGISGGQRRRVSVATALLRLPACLLLDEPTSGLDATNALSLVKSLHTFAHRGGANIIMTIHQPRKEIFRFLDTLTILVGGRILFAGAPKEAFDHFEISRRLNIGDEILDQLGKAQLDTILGFQQKYENGPLGQRMEASLSKELVFEFDEQLAAGLRFTLEMSAIADGRWSWTESSSAPLLLYVLLSRTIKRGGFDLLKTVTISLFGGLLVGLVFLGSADSYARHVSMAYLSVATMTFLQGTFIGDRYWGEKFMYTFESEAGTARPWLSFLASLFARIIVSATCEALAFAIPVFFLGRMHNEDDQVRMYLLTLTMCAITTATQYLMVEIYFMKPDDKRTGALVNIALLSMSALFNGFIIQLKDLPIYLVWIPYTMLSYWAFVGVLINDLSAFQIPCDASVLECSARSGDAVVKGLQYDNRDVFQCLFALLIMTGIFILGGVLFFFFKWVSPFGTGLKRANSKEEALEEENFFVKFREQAGEMSTMKAILEDGKKMNRTGSDGKIVKRVGSDGKIVRNPSDLSSNMSDGGGDGPSSRVLFNPPSSPDFNNDNDNESAKTLVLPMGANEQQFEDDEIIDPPRSCCPSDNWLVTSFLSRVFLGMYFILDFLTSAVICNGQEEVEIGSSSSSFSLNVSNLDFSGANGVNMVFVYVTGFFLAGYVLQFVVQLFFLFPQKACTRMVFLNLLGLIMMAIDFLLLIVLATTPSGSENQIYFLVGIRAVRLVRVLSFWFTISSFHSERVNYYLEFKLGLLEEFVSEGENLGNDLGEHLGDKKPPIPAKSTKPQIDPALIRDLDKRLAPPPEAPKTFIGRAIKSVRFLGGTGETAEQTRKSLQKRMSVVTHHRVSAKLGPSPAPVLPPRGGGAPPTLPARSRPSLKESSRPPPTVPSRGGAGPPITSMRGLPHSMQIAPPVVPSRSVASNRISTARGVSMANRISMARGGAVSGSLNPNRPNTTSRGPPPPIPPRVGNSIAGFGVSPDAMRVMQGRPSQHRPQPKFKPSQDEI